MTHLELANFIWQIADLLRGPYRPPQYERVMLPLVVLRRFDCVLADTKDKVTASYKRLKKYNPKTHDLKLNMIAGGGKDLGFHNHSDLDFEKLKGDPDNIGRHLAMYIDGFSENVTDIFVKYFDFGKEIEKLEEANRLYLVVSKFADVDLGHLDTDAMGLLFEDLIRRFNEAANETAGDHFTPREVIRLMVNLLLEPDDKVLTEPGIVATICDPACGTGGMLSEAEKWINEHHEDVNVRVFGQDYNPRSYAVAASDLLIKGQHDGRIEYGNTLIDENFPGMEFDYLLANPPFGVDWKAEKKELERRSSFHGYEGKLPRVNDGALLFLLYMIGHFQEINLDEKKIGSRCAIVFNGSPLFTGGAGSGESEIRRWIIENDWLEAIVALPEQMFYNTGIGTFIWVVTNRKAKDRKGKIQLIDARQRYQPMRRSLGDKRRYIDDKSIDAISREHGSKRKSDTCKMFDNADFGYRRVIIERPLRLRFQMTQRSDRVVSGMRTPQFLDTVRAIESELGTEQHLDWNEVWEAVQEVAKNEELKLTSASKKVFRKCYTTVDPDAKPVIAKRLKKFEFDAKAAFLKQKLKAKLDERELAATVGVNFSSQKETIEYEADSNLRDNENIPLKEHVVDFFLREVRPFVDDAWIDRASKSARDELDRGIGKVGYDVNFNREFFTYEKPRKLRTINEELEKVEDRILHLLQKVTK